jgi:hypothetical protein
MSKKFSWGTPKVNGREGGREKGRKGRGEERGRVMG